MKDIKDMDTEEFINECRKQQKRTDEALKSAEVFEAKLDKIEAEKVDKWLAHMYGGKNETK